MTKPKQLSLAEPITDKQREDAEKQIVENVRVVDYDTKEYPVEVLVSKYLIGIENDENELFIPDYQRKFVWDIKRQSKFIESIIIGLPVPYLFVADVVEKDARLEIVDGSQRVRSLAAFQNDELVLEGLNKLSKLNGFKFSDLPIARQRRFRGRGLRTIVLSEKADEKVRRDIFERINTGSDVLNAMEVRRGIKPGPFLDFIKRCAANETFRELAPLAVASENRREREEFVLRYFAYSDNYQGFVRSVIEFLDSYLEETEKAFDPTEATYDKKVEERLNREFNEMLAFVQKYFPNGFAKKLASKKTASRTPRIRFEAIAVGTTLALRQNRNLRVSDTEWTESPQFQQLVTSDSSNSKPKVVRRIEFVRDALLDSTIKTTK